MSEDEEWVKMARDDKATPVAEVAQSRVDLQVAGGDTGDDDTTTEEEVHRLPRAVNSACGGEVEELLVNENEGDPEADREQVDGGTEDSPGVKDAQVKGEESTEPEARAATSNSAQPAGQVQGDDSSDGDATEELQQASDDAEEVFVVERSFSLDVLCLDGKVVNLHIKPSAAVLDVARLVGETLNVRFKEEYGLSYCNNLGWLDEQACLGEQLTLHAASPPAEAGDAASSPLQVMYKKKYYISDDEIRERDTADVSLMFPQALQLLRQGFLACSQGQAVGLAALAVKTLELEADGRMPTVSEIATMLPEVFRNGAIVKSVIDNTPQLNELSIETAKYQFVKICTSLPGYGTIAYVVTEVGSRKPILLGISRAGISKMDVKSKQQLESFTLKQIYNWACSKEMFVFDFGEARECQWGVQTRHGRNIGQIINGLFRLLTERETMLQLKKNTIVL